MKTITNIMTAAFLSSVLFSACTKDNDLAVQPSNGDNLAVNSPITKISEDLMIVNFTEGYLIADYIKIQLEDQSEEISGVQKVNLFKPVAGADIPAGHYTRLSMSMRALPNSDGMSMYLRGETIFSDGVTVPIVFQLGEEMILYSTSGPIDITDRSTYLDLLRVKQTALLQGIGEDDLRDAERVNNEIYLSSTINPVLHRAVFNNLEKMTGVKILRDGDGGGLLEADLIADVK